MNKLQEEGKWYIIHTHSGFEAKVITRLQEEIEKKIYQIFSPNF